MKALYGLKSLYQNVKHTLGLDTTPPHTKKQTTFITRLSFLPLRSDLIHFSFSHNNYCHAPFINIIASCTCSDFFQNKYIQGHVGSCLVVLIAVVEHEWSTKLLNRTCSCFSSINSAKSKAYTFIATNNMKILFVPKKIIMEILQKEIPGLFIYLNNLR